jgi:hypothetical protein
MAIQKERRAAPRKPGTKANGSAADRAAAPKPAEAREMPAKAPTAERPRPEDGKPRPEEIRRRIEVAAYLRAKQRGFTPGYELDDWLKAEAEIKNRAPL